MIEKSPEAFRTISEVAEDLELPQHVLRFWETRFSQIRPMKRGGGRRYYRPEDVELLRGIRHLLYEDGYTIKGVQRILKERGVRQVARRYGSLGAVSAPAEPAGPAEDHGAHPRYGQEQVVVAGFAETSDEGSDRSAQQTRLPAEVERTLHSALFELTECRRILADALDDN